MSDRSLGDFLGGGLFWTAVLHLTTTSIGGVFSGIGKFLVWFIILGWLGFFVQLVTGSDLPQRGPISASEVQVSAWGTLDRLDVRAYNTNSVHEITLLNMNCGGEDVMIRRIPAGSSQVYSTFAGNIARGQIQCEILKVRSE